MAMAARLLPLLSALLLSLLPPLASARRVLCLHGLGGSAFPFLNMHLKPLRGAAAASYKDWRPVAWEFDAVDSPRASGGWWEYAPAGGKSTTAEELVGLEESLDLVEREIVEGGWRLSPSLCSAALLLCCAAVLLQCCCSAAAVLLFCVIAPPRPPLWSLWWSCGFCCCSAALLCCCSAVLLLCCAAAVAAAVPPPPPVVLWSVVAVAAAWIPP